LTVIFVTGMSGVGKSTTPAELTRRGHRAVETDHGGRLAEVDGEPLWRADRIDGLLAQHERSGEPLFLSGAVANQALFYPRFAEIVLLSAPLPVMLARVAGERARIVADTAKVEPLLRASTTAEIDTRLPSATSSTGWCS
jgi:hypothetical protein